MADGTPISFSRSVGLTLATRLGSVSSTALAGVIVARWLGPEGVGILGSLSVVTMLAVMFGGLGLPSAITYLTARDRNVTRRVALASALIALGAGSVLAAIVTFASLRSPGFAGLPGEFVRIAMASVPFVILTQFTMSLYLGLGRIRAYNVVEFALQTTGLANTAIILVGLGLGLEAVVVFGAAANIFLALFVVSVFAGSLDREHGNWSIDRELIAELLSCGSRFFVAMAAAFVIIRGDLLIVAYFRGAGEAGVYAVATQLAAFMHMVPNVVSTVLFPRTAGEQDASGTTTCRVTRHAVFIMGVVCIASVPAVFLAPTIYGASFGDIPLQFLILLPGVFLLGIEMIQVQHLSGLGLPVFVPVMWVVILVVNLALNFTLVPAFGGLGAAAGASLSYALAFVAIALYFRRSTGSTFAEMFLIKRGEISRFAGTFRRDVQA